MLGRVAGTWVSWEFGWGWEEEAGEEVEAGATWTGGLVGAKAGWGSWSGEQIGGVGTRGS